MCTQIQLKEYLEEISEDAKFVLFDYASPERFQVILRCKVKVDETVDYYNNYAKDWIKKFSAFTATAWTVRCCYPNLKRIVFKKSFSCHRSAHNKSKSSATSRNLHCKAKIDFKVKFINRNTMKNDQYLQEGLNMNISIAYEHSHLVNDMDSYILLNSSPESNLLFYEFFDNGYTPAAAKCYHELRLIEQYGQESDELANASMNPKLRHIEYLHRQRWEQKTINVNDVIIKKIETLEKIGHTIRYSEAPLFVVILTPLMKRVISQVGVEQVLINTTLESSTTFTIFLYLPSMIGSLPIACLIFTKQSETIYIQMFLTVKLTIESVCNINFTPELILYDNIKLRTGLNTIFPTAIIKYNRYSVCRDIWEWICDDVNCVRPENRHQFMTCFKALLYEKRMEEAVATYDCIKGSRILRSFTKKLDDVWQDRHHWLESRQSEGFNDAPVAFMKEFLLQRCKPFNLCSMVDVVTNVIENHYQKVLLSHTTEDVVQVYTKFLGKVKISEDSLKKLGPKEYSIQCELNKEQYYLVNLDTMCCDCKEGKKARLCEHLCGMINITEHDFALFPSLTEDEKFKFLKIMGDENYTIKHENEHDFIEINEMEIDNDRPIIPPLKDNDEQEVKMETVQDPLEENHEDDSSRGTKEDMKEKYEAAMKSLNDEFRRLNKLFKGNPNRSNLATMQRLAKELSKIVVVQKVELSNMLVTINNTSESGGS